MASGFGVSANPTKANHKIGEDKFVRIAVQNHNDFSAGPNLIPQRKVNGKWETIKTNSPNPLNPGEKLYDQYIGIYLNNLGKRCIKQLLINKQHLKRK
ncbi:structural protein [Bacillus safensis]|uniref:structural protein n=1 Tax=Bacillus safensis TaxID=561879 RepID=UPI001E564D03|nr:structural protein [Bacillus safensis]